MLRLIMDRGAIAIPTPSFFLMDFKAIQRGAVDLSDPNALDSFISQVWDHPKVELWNLEATRPETPSGLGHDDAYRFAVSSVFAAYAEQEGKTRWGDKTAPYVFSIDDILAIWPDAKMIVLVRDGRDVALSVIPLPFGPNTVLAAAQNWVRGIDVGLTAAARHPDSVLTMRYEDLVTEPEVAVPLVAEFVGIDYDESMLRLDENPAGRVDQFQTSFHPNVYKPINTGSVEKWKTQMSRRDLELFEYAAGDWLEILGYDRGPVGPAPTRAELFKSRVTNGAGRTSNFVKHRLITERGHELRYVLRRKRDNAMRKVSARSTTAATESRNPADPPV
jgi:hypothetical protein